MSTYKWMLRRGGKKERCPQCGKMRFVPFVLTADSTVKAGPEYGRCDREQSCGYFRYPGGEVKMDTEREYTPEPPKEPILFAADFAENDSPTASNSLLRAYADLVGMGKLRATMTRYRCGTGGRGECIYYQYDGLHVRTAKAILYGTDGHRIKERDGGLPVWWMHKSPQLRQYTAGKELRQCLFGQHLLNERDADGMAVYIVEGEKTAVLMAATEHTGRNRLWLACGGSQMLKGAIDLMPLMGRNVTLVPDDGQYWNWRRTADAYEWKCLDVEPMKEYHRLPDGCDIWDCREAALRKEAAK